MVILHGICYFIAWVRTATREDGDEMVMIENRRLVGLWSSLLHFQGANLE